MELAALALAFALGALFHWAVSTKWGSLEMVRPQLTRIHEILAARVTRFEEFKDELSEDDLDECHRLWQSGKPCPPDLTKKLAQHATYLRLSYENHIQLTRSIRDGLGNALRGFPAKD